MPTPAELAFLRQHRIPASEIFHAEGLPKKRYRLMMDELDAILVTGAAPCKAAGHTIRTKSGHCAQCDTSRIAFQRRYRANGFVYVAWSRRLDLVKVGSSLDPDQRIASLSQSGYGGATDWRLVRQFWCSQAGSVEFHAHAQLESKLEEVNYYRDGVEVLCREVFRVPASIAVDAVAKAAQDQRKPKVPRGTHCRGSRGLN